MRAGQLVTVVDATDEFCDLKHIGRTGIVVRVEEGTAGVGDSPGDPFISVWFGPNDRDGFWTEELVPARWRTTKRLLGAFRRLGVLGRWWS